MQLILTRDPLPLSGESGAPGAERGVRGTLAPLNIPTLENALYLIPCGTYPLTVTYSPRFRRPLPLVCNVVGAPDDPHRPRVGIRFHPGTRPEHSQGCILVSRQDEQRLREYINTHAPVTLKIVSRI